MFIAQDLLNLDGAVRRSGTQVYRYRPSSFRSSERRIVFVVLGSINISLLRSEDTHVADSDNYVSIRSIIRPARSPGAVQVKEPTWIIQRESLMERSR
jgi:hypothetical protein